MRKNENLKPVRNRAEASELGRKGGIASGIARREKRFLSDYLREGLERESPNGILKSVRIIEALIDKAYLEGDVRAMGLIFDRTEGKALQQVRVEENTSIAQALLGARKRLREI